MQSIPFVTNAGVIRADMMYPPTTTTTYVYSRPVISSSFHRNIRLGQNGCPSWNISGNATEVMQPKGILGYQADEPIITPRRTHFTVYQREELEKTFSQSQYISPRKRQSLSQELGISKEVILTWFKNRRAKWRREQRKTGTRPAGGCVASGPYCRYFGHMPYPSSKLMLSDALMLYGTTVTAHASNDD
ncbi:ESX homeobox 1 [Desmophyllum pertusum]|uniref:ESX homeobox 1 n=1 Tax=Desmophyllum pertusum TaxID=174260 RepID=A0A9X0A5T3_9CNID|nr:ESX homeobox 1 [Desmophyllum pertusum]